MSDGEAPGTPETPSDEPSWFGCLVPFTAVITIFGLGTCIVTNGLRQSSEIQKFAKDEPAMVEVIQPSEAQLAAVEAKLAQLTEAAKNLEEVTVKFTEEDLNVLLASKPALETYRDTTKIRSISPQALRVAGSQPAKKLSGGLRYIVGDFLFTIDRSGSNYWQLILEDVQIPGKDVPEGFINMWSTLHMFRFSIDNTELEPVFKQVKSIELEQGAIAVTTAEGQLEPPN